MAELNIKVTASGSTKHVQLSESSIRLILSDVATSYELQLAISELVATFAEKRFPDLQAINCGVEAVVSPS